MLNLKQVITGQIRDIDSKYIHTEETDDVTGVVSRCMYRKSDYRIAYNDNNITLTN